MDLNKIQCQKCQKYQTNETKVTGVVTGKGGGGILWFKSFGIEAQIASFAILGYTSFIRVLLVGSHPPHIQIWSKCPPQYID